MFILNLFRYIILMWEVNDPTNTKYVLMYKFKWATNGWPGNYLDTNDTLILYFLNISPWHDKSSTDDYLSSWYWISPRNLKFGLGQWMCHGIWQYCLKLWWVQSWKAKHGHAWFQNLIFLQDKFDLRPCGQQVSKFYF